VAPALRLPVARNARSVFLCELSPVDGENEGLSSVRHDRPTHELGGLGSVTDDGACSKRPSIGHCLRPLGSINAPSSAGDEVADHGRFPCVAPSLRWFKDLVRRAQR
jgi:hypothetical protein